MGKIITSFNKNWIWFTILTLNLFIVGVQIPLLAHINLEVEWFLTNSIIQNISIFTESTRNCSSDFSQTIFNIRNGRTKNVSFQIISIFALATFSEWSVGDTLRNLSSHGLAEITGSQKEMLVATKIALMNDWLRVDITRSYFIMRNTSGRCVVGISAPYVSIHTFLTKYLRCINVTVGNGSSNTGIVYCIKSWKTCFTSERNSLFCWGFIDSAIFNMRSAF